MVGGQGPVPLPEFFRKFRLASVKHRCDGDQRSGYEDPYLVPPRLELPLMSESWTTRFPTLDVTRDGPILRVWLNRPDSLNPLDTATLDGLANVFTAVNTDFSVRAVVLGGHGRAFSAGADRKNPPKSERLSANSGATERERRHASQIGRRACQAIIDCEVPTIARLHGWVIGGGLAIAGACDFRIAASSTTFSIPEVDLGIPLAWGATPRLIAEIGAAKARELILMCDRFDAAEAYRLGLVHRTVDHADLDGAVDDWAHRLSEKAEIAVHEVKTAFRAYSRMAALGDVTETDGDLMVQASRMPTAKAAFPRMNP